MTSQLVAETVYLMPDGQEILIRPIRKTDLPALEWEGEYTHFRRLYAEHYRSSLSGTTLIWVAETAAGIVIGQVFVLLYATNADVADGINRAYLFSFRIKPEWRSQGLGSFMLRFVEEQLLQRGYSSLRLNVARTNPLARNLYEKHGYRMVGPDPGTWRYQDHEGHWHAVREPAWRMLKKLR